MTDSPTPALLSDEQIAEIRAKMGAGELYLNAANINEFRALLDHALAASAALAEREGEIAKLKQPLGAQASEAFINGSATNPPEPNVALSEAARRYIRDRNWSAITEIINKHINASDHNMFGVAVRSAEEILPLLEACAETAEATIARQAAEIADWEAVVAQRDAEILAMKKPWGDKDDEWTPAIRAAHPTNTKDFDTYAVALEMVGHRHGKYELVDLVNWLLSRAALTGGGGT